MSEINTIIEQSGILENSPEGMIPPGLVEDAVIEESSPRVIPTPKIKEEIEVILPVLPSKSVGKFSYGFLIPEGATEENIPTPIEAMLRYVNGETPLH